MKRKLDFDGLYKKLEMINYWISNADNKAIGALGFIGIILTIIFSNSDISQNLALIATEVFVDIRFDDILFLTMIGLFIVIAFYGLWLLVKVLLPKLAIQKTSLVSFIFFADIAKCNSYQEYTKNLEKASDDDVANDLLNQIYQNSVICTQKHNNFSNGFKFFLVGIVGLVILYCIGATIYAKAGI